MIKRLILSVGLVTLLTIIQSTWLDAIAIYNIIPDISLLVIVYISFKNQNMQGQVTGFISGILQDGISSAPIGLNAFIKTVIASLSNVLSGKFYIDKILMPAIFGFSVTILKAILHMLLYIIFSNKFLRYNFFTYMIWLEALYNAVVAPIVFLLLKPLDRFLIEHGKNT